MRVAPLRDPLDFDFSLTCGKYPILIIDIYPVAFLGYASISPHLTPSLDSSAQHFSTSILAITPCYRSLHSCFSVLSCTRRRTVSNNDLQFIFLLFNFTMSRSRILSRRQIEGFIADSQLIVIYDNKVLRLDKWVEKHPGGKLPILHMVGRDATDEIQM